MDDHPDTCDLFEAAFRAVGIEIVGAFDGPSGLGMVDSGRWDAIVLDADMPTMDGWEFLRQLQLKPNGAAIPVIMVSAHASLEMRRRALERGCTNYYAKPVMPVALATALRAVIYPPSPEVLRPPNQSNA